MAVSSAFPAVAGGFICGAVPSVATSDVAIPRPGNMRVLTPMRRAIGSSRASNPARAGTTTTARTRSETVRRSPHLSTTRSPSRPPGRRGRCLTTGNGNSTSHAAISWAREVDVDCCGPETWMPRLGVRWWRINRLIETSPSVLGIPEPKDTYATRRFYLHRRRWAAHSPRVRFPVPLDLDRGRRCLRHLPQPRSLQLGESVVDALHLRPPAGRRARLRCTNIKRKTAHNTKRSASSREDRVQLAPRTTSTNSPTSRIAEC
jgi:hypothetical protein